MNTLHLIFSDDGMNDCVKVARANDTLVLMQDGVYVDAHALSNAVCVLSEDARARGVEERLSESVRRIDYDDLVQLVENHQPIVTWSR